MTERIAYNEYAKLKDNTIITLRGKSWSEKAARGCTNEIDAIDKDREVWVA